MKKIRKKLVYTMNFGLNLKSLESLNWFMGTSSTKKLLRKIDNTIPGLSKILDPRNFDLSWEEDAAIELASSLILASEKKKKLEKTGTKTGKRRQFSKLTKQEVLINQKFQCAKCKDPLDIADFDHIDGDKSNNDVSNCQALCPNCHAKKTRKKS